MDEEYDAELSEFALSLLPFSGVNDIFGLDDSCIDESSHESSPETTSSPCFERSSESYLRSASLDSSSDSNSCSSTSSPLLKPAPVPSRSRKSTDKAAERKLKNRESASRSYLKKKEYISTLEKENRELKAEVARLKAQLEATGMIPIPLKQQCTENISGASTLLPLHRDTSDDKSDKSGTSSKKRRRGDRALPLLTIPIAVASSAMCMVDNTVAPSAKNLAGSAYDQYPLMTVPTSIALGVVLLAVIFLVTRRNAEQFRVKCAL